MTVGILLLIHILVCIFVGIGIFFRIFHSSWSAFFLVMLVPFWGIGTFLLLELSLRNQKDGIPVGLERLTTNDEIHRSILMDEDALKEEIVPLEEALILNDSHVRRELLMDVLYSDPGEYVEQLKEARMNHDPEVVHYAVTALVELQKEYDLKFQKLDRRYKKNPEDMEILDEYLNLLENYTASGILEGNLLKVQKQRLCELLNEKIRRIPDIKELYRKKAEVCLELGEYEDAYSAGKEMTIRWSTQEDGYLILIQYFAAVQNRRELDNTIEKMRKKEVFLSEKGKEVIRFWDEKR